MKDKDTILNQVENQIEKLANRAAKGAYKLESKVMDGAEYIEEKAYKGAHKLTKGTESLVEHTLDGLDYIEGQLKLK